MPKTVRILSIDGGGIRGVIPATFLAELEKRTGRRIFELFDIIAGTSTGGILTAALTCRDPKNAERARYRAQDVLQMYFDQGERIFSGKATLPEMFFRQSYLSYGIEKVLKEFFGDARLKDALTHILITAYEIENRSTFVFNSDRAKAQPEGWDYDLWKVARATSAAPTFFSPYKLEQKGLTLKIADPKTGKYEKKSVPYYALVDGGVFANNPTMLAYGEAMRFRGETGTHDVNDQSFYVVSLGTGDPYKGLPLSQVGSALAWVLSKGAPVISTFFQAGSASVDQQAFRIFGHHPDKYYRFQTLIAPEIEPMDNAKKSNIVALQKAAHQTIALQSELIDVLKDELLGLLPQRNGGGSDE